MKKRIYIDTSVIGGCLDEEFSEWSNKLFNEFKSGSSIAVVSSVTLDELDPAPDKIKKVLAQLEEKHIEIVSLTDEARELAKLYIKEKAISKKSNADAQHIAIASIERVNVLVSWNFKHIVNLDRIHAYNAVNMKYGYPMIEIRTPREVLYEKDI